jgi:hypothetical protein
MGASTQFTSTDDVVRQIEIPRYGLVRLRGLRGAKESRPGKPLSGSH